MKKVIPILLGFLFLIIPHFVQAEQKIDLYFFYGEGCPHCEKEDAFLQQMVIKYPDLVIHKYEVWHNSENSSLLMKIAKELNIDVTGVPVLIIGNNAVSGYYDAATSGNKIESMIKNYSLFPTANDVNNIISNQADKNSQENKKNNFVPEKINVPLVGALKIKTMSLPVLTVIVAALDGLNPCAMWVLLLLVNLLLGMKDKRRMIILGSAFIATSGILYFLFLAAWLNLLLFLGFVFWIRIIIGLVAVGGGSYHIKDWWDNRDGGCNVMDISKRRQVSQKVKEIVAEKNFWLALMSIIFLAAAINLVELVCSAGLPAIYTQVLTLSNLSIWQHYAYLLLYVLVFMSDSIILFLVAIKTFELRATESKFAKYSMLIGGVIMLILGILLIFKPGWLMFG